MKLSLSLCIYALAACILSGCAPAAPPVPVDTHDADMKAIAETEAAANKAWAAKDFASLAAYYADDATLIVSGSDPLQGKAAVIDALKHMMSDPALALTFHADKIEVAKSGDLGYAIGPYQLTITDPVSKKPIHDHGSYVTTFHKQADGSWKVSVDIVASAIPPMPPPKR